MLRRVESGTAILVVGEESLRRYLAEGRGFRNAGVRMDDGVVTITGQITILNALVDVTLRAGLVVRDGRHLALDVQQLRVSGLEVPRDVGIEQEGQVLGFDLQHGKFLPVIFFHFFTSFVR